jgi:lipoate-protein ligase A
MKLQNWYEMRCIRSQNTNPYFNLAAEEYLLKNYSEDIYFQYVNTPSVIVGKHQNAIAEIDVEYLQENGILLARRISGGGAVYHDKGNVNYSFITNEVPGDFVKFKKYTAPVIEILRKLGLDASLGKRNEIRIGEEKISGTASHVFKSRVLHHGTLLFNADLQVLARCLYVNTDRFKDKAVKSVRSNVVNIEELLVTPMSNEEFYDHLFSSIMEIYNEPDEMYLSREDNFAIETLMDEKFRFWEWNYGYSPKYIVDNILTIESVQISIATSVSKGLIENIEIKGNLLNFDVQQINSLLPGTKHHKQAVDEKLAAFITDPEKRRIILEGIF